MSAATFPCPHCGVVYPFKPVLVGQVVRCKACKLAFRLRQDGIADKVAAAPSPTAEPRAAVAAAPAPRPPAPRPPAAPAPAPAPAPSPSPSAPSASNRPSERMTKGQQNTRDEIAASLKASMSAVMGSEALKEESPARAKTDRAKRNRTPARGPDGKPQLSPAVLTGEGEREATISRQWTLSIIAVLIVVVGSIWWLRQDNAKDAAISAFVAIEDDSKYSKHPVRLERIQKRAVLVKDAFAGGPTAGFISMPDLRFGSVHEIKGSVLAEIAEKLIAKPNLDAKAATKIASDAGLDEDPARTALSLLLGETGPGVNDLRERIAKNAPTEVQWCEFHGRKGTHLMDIGSGYKSTDKPYRGTLIRFRGVGWDAPWRVLTVAPDRRD